MSGAVLIFPAGGDGASSFRAAAQAQGRKVVGASSITPDPARAAYAHWETLPHVNAPAFDAQLAEALERHDVQEVYAAHSVVWMHLSSALRRLRPSARLLDGRAGSAVEESYRDLEARIAAAPSTPDLSASPIASKPALSGVERTGLVRLVETIPGMCSLEKMLTVAEVMRHAPCGDVVEIGSWWGRSAALFCWLARRHEVGAVLCVDPWTLEGLPQGDAVLDAASAAMDVDQALRMFEINLAPLAGGRLNYLRLPSVEAAARYGPGLGVCSGAFGHSRYEGGIALLHIDGNHAYENVSADAAAWTDKVKPGGWIVFDDYEWPFGDGPRRVADAYIAEHAASVALSFVAGGAMFVQLSA